jgi:hypothetical protein
MRPLYLLAPLGLVAVLAGCSTTTYTPASVAVAPAYVMTPPATIVLGSGPAWVDSDGDRVPNHLDAYPFDSRFR